MYTLYVCNKDPITVVSFSANFFHLNIKGGCKYWRYNLFSKNLKEKINGRYIKINIYVNDHVTNYHEK